MLATQIINSSLFTINFSLELLKFKQYLLILGKENTYTILAYKFRRTRDFLSPIHEPREDSILASTWKSMLL